MKEKGRLSWWMLGVSLTLSMYLLKAFSPYFGVSIDASLADITIIAGIVIVSTDIITRFWAKHAIVDFFHKVGITETKKIRKTSTSNGYDLYLKLPIGKGSSDFNKYKEALEQYLNSQVNISYKDKSIKVSVSNESPIA